MSGKAFRFIHASDLHLELPLQGVTEVPEPLRDGFIEAPRSAAERVFDAAIQEKVDFVLLAGHVLDLRRADAGTVDLLYRQFWRMREAGIVVVWCATPSESAGDWPVSVELPANVHLVTDPMLTAIPVHRGELTLCHILVAGGGLGVDDFRRQTFPGTPGATVALVHGDFGSALSLSLADTTYWAFGGQHARADLPGLRGRGGYCGTPQGRNLREQGAHGCSLVEVDSARQVRERFIPTDVFRWLTHPIAMPDDLDQAGLVRMLRERADRISEASAGRKVLVQWILEDTDTSRDTRSDLLASRLRRGDVAGEIVRILRKELTEARSPVWPLGVTTEPPEALPLGWYEEDTILGDLLRTVQTYQADSNLPLEIDLPSHAEDWLVKAGIDPRVDTPEERKRLLRKVAVLGVDLLRGDRVLSSEI